MDRLPLSHERSKVSVTNVTVSDPAVGSKIRLYFADYLRAALVSLVVLHHLAISYGGSGSFYYTETATGSAAAGLLTLFTGFNQAWFLGAFFLISGYFSPGSFDRRGAKQYLKDRLIRLLIPLLIFFFVLNPITVYIAFSHLPASQLAGTGITLPLAFNWQFYMHAVGTGPLWFVEMLLIFEFGYICFRVATRKRSGKVESGTTFPSFRRIAVFILLFASASYLIRIALPINAYLLGFPSLFDLPQYLSFFIIGTVAARGDWLRKMPGFMARRVFIFALVATLTLLLLAIIGTEVSSLGWGSLAGYGSLSSAFYAMWEATFAVGMTMFAVAFFRSHFNSPGRLWNFFSKHFYTAYILQAPVIVTVTAVALSSVHIESLLKFGLAAVIVLPLLWSVAYAVRKIPFANKVL